MATFRRKASKILFDSLTDKYSFHIPSLCRYEVQYTFIKYGVSIDKASQAFDIMDLLEKRGLLKTYEFEAPLSDQTYLLAQTKT